MSTSDQVGIPFSDDPATEALRESVEIFRGNLGNPLDKAVRVRDLLNIGLLNQNPAYNSGNASSASPFVPSTETIDDATPPDRVTGLTAAGIFTSIILEWDSFQDERISYTEVWRNTTDNLSTAVLHGTTEALLYVDSSANHGQTYYYWIRPVSFANVPGAFNNAAGTSAGLTDHLDSVFGVLTEAYGGGSDAPFFQLDVPTLINGVTIPAGTYIYAAKIHDASITTAKIQDAAIETAKIADAAIETAKIKDANIVTAKIADAAITTAKIGTAAIGTAQIADAAVGSAQIGDAQIVTAKIQDAAVDTLQLAGQAVTIPVGAYTAAESDGFSGETTIQSATITATGGSVPVSIIFSAKIYGTSSQLLYKTGTLLLYRDTTLLYSTDWLCDEYSNPDWEPTNIAGTIIDEPTSGSHTYYLKATGGGWHAYNRSLTLLELKR